MNRDSGMNSAPEAAEVIAVDDEPVTREMICLMLKKHGINVAGCADGAGMWAAVEHHRPRLVLLDVEMPGEDGFLLAERLRARFGLGIAIIMLTARELSADKEIGRHAGVDDYLTKPCDWRLLVSLVRRYLEAARN